MAFAKELLYSSPKLEEQLKKAQQQRPIVENTEAVDAKMADIGKSISTENMKTGESEPDPKLSMQQKKESFFESRIPSTMDRAKADADAAKKALSDYLVSEERKQRTAELEKKNSLDRMIADLFSGALDLYRPEVIRDEKEEQLRQASANADRALQTAQESKELEDYILENPGDNGGNDAVKAEYLKKYAGMPVEDRLALQRYVAQRDTDFYNTLNFQQNGIQVGNAEQQASGLFAKYGEDEINRMAEAYSWYKGEKDNKKFAEAGQQFGQEHPYLASAASLPLNVYAGTSGLFGRVNEAKNRTGMFDTLNPNNQGDFISTFSGNARVAASGEIGQWVGRMLAAGDPNNNIDLMSNYGRTAEDAQGDADALNKVGQYAYNGIMTFADNLARIYFGGGAIAAGTLAATNTFAQTITEASQQGATPQQAALLATTKAGIEFLTEKFSLEKLVTMSSGADFAAILMNTGKQALVEVSEEEASLIASVLAEAKILREKSNYQLKIKDYMAQGATEEEALERANSEFINEVIETAIVSSIAGGLGGAQATAKGAYVDTRKSAQAAQEQTADTAQQAQAATETAQTEQGQQQKQEAHVGENQPTGTPTFEELSAKGDIPIVNVARDVTGKTYAQLKSGVLDMATFGKWFDKPYTNTDTGMPIFLTNKSFTHSFSNLSADFGTDTLLALEHTPELLQNAVLVNTAQPKDTRKGETNVHTFFAAVNGENGTEPVKITVKEYADKPGNTPPKNILAYFKAQKASKDYNTLYDLKALEVVGIESTKKEFGASASAANGETPSGAKSTPNSTISVANLLGLVKGDAEKYIPKNPQSINAVDPGATPKADSVGTSMNGIPKNGVGVNGNSVNPEPGIKGTGAAEQNFTGKADYQSLLTDENTQRDRPGDVRPMEVPKQDAYGRKVSEFVGNAYGAEVTPDRMANAIESLVQDGKLGFESRSNKQSLENARQSILATSEKETMLSIHDHAEKGAVYDGDVEKALVLYASYANNPEAQDEASSVFVDMVKLAHMSGRNLQLFSLMRRMTPEGQLMTAQKNINRYIDEINKSRPARKKVDASGTNEQAAQAAAAVEKSRENTEAAIGKAPKLVKYRKGKVEIEGNQAGEPFVFEYAQKVGEGLAKGLERSLQPKKEKTFMQLITEELRKFASEKMPQQERKKALTATELLRDYIQNQDFYTRAWEEAQQTIRDGGKIDSALEEFVNSGIGVDANNSAKNKIFTKALAAAALESGETAQMLKRQEALGFSNMSETIANRLIAQTGATGEMADTIRDAAKSYVNDQLSVENQKAGKQTKASEKIVQSSIRSAMQDIKETLSKVAISDADAKKTVKERITDVLVKKYGFGKADAGGVADVVGQQYEAMVKAQAEKLLEQKFAKRGEKAPKSTEQVLRELANLGAFSADSEYNRQATAKVLGEKFNATISEELADNFLKAKTDEEKQAALDAIYKDVASGIKPTLGEMWDAWRNLSMMGNLKTQIRNFGSTGVWQPYVEVKRDIGAAVESVVLRNKRNERTKSFLGTGKGDKDLIAWAKQDAKSKDAQRLMEYSGYTGNDAKNAIQDYRQILPGVLDTARKKNMELMENSDMLYKRNEYSRSLASFLKARGYTAEQLSSGEVPKSVLDQGRQYAVKEAMKATFNDRNSFSDSIVKLMKPKGDSPAILNIIKKGTIPFLRTPANIIHRAYEYSPASLGITLLTAKRDIDSGRMSASDVIDRVSSGLTGSAAMGFGAALAAGIVPGVRLVAEPDDDELLAGAQAYSIKIGGKYYAAGWLAPAMIPLFIGARLYEDITRKAQDEDGVNAWDVVEALVDTCAHSLDPLLELSMLSSFKTILESFSNAESYSEKAAAVVVNSVLEYFSQGIPTLFGQIEQATEAEKKSIYVNTENNIEKVVKKSIGNATKKIPGIDLYQTQKLDSFGEPVEAGDDYRKRIFDAFLNPASVTEETKDPVVKEIIRLNSVQENSVTPPYAAKTISYTDSSGEKHLDQRLTEEQYQTLSTTQGETAKRIVTEMIASKDYAAMTDEQKALAIRQAYTYARETGEIAAMDDHYGYSESWMRQMKEGKEASEILRRVAGSELSKAVSALDDAWDNNWDSAQYSEALRTAYDSYKSMTPAAKREVRETATGTTAKYIEAREKGISHEDFLAAAENVATVKGTGSNGTVRDIDRRRAIANTTGLSQKEIDIIMKCYMPDYDPNGKSTDTTEVKYDYIRQEMGLSAKKYVAAYQAYLDNDKKRNPTIAAIQESLGCDYGTALKLYNVYDGEKWTKRTMLSWYEKQ